ncbi:MAG: VWA domain-containing protein [Acidobacteriota bacterium]
MGRVISLVAPELASPRPGRPKPGVCSVDPFEPPAPPGGAQRSVLRPYLRIRATAARLLPSLLLPLWIGPAVDQSEQAAKQRSSLALARADFRVVVDTVLLSVGVHRPDGPTNTELTRSDFVVFEDGIPRRITYFSPTNSPLSVVLLVDSSQSMSIGALPQAKKASLQFVRESHPDTQFSIVAFNDDVVRVLDFTNDRVAIEGALNKLEAKGGTRLYDGIKEAVEHWERAQNRARVIVLLTDGRDENSTTARTEIERLLETSPVTLFPCGVYSPAYRRLFMNDRKYYMKPDVEENLNPVWILRHIAELCGTQALFTEPERPLEQALSEITSELQHRYLLGFEPAPSLADPRYRTIEVRLKNHTNARIQARRWYVR